MASSTPSVSTKGFQNASSYDKHRPSYPPKAVTRFLEHLQINGVKKARIVDLAAGTGKFTELLVGRDEDFEILAVEPHSGMSIREQSFINLYKYPVLKVETCFKSRNSYLSFIEIPDLSYDLCIKYFL